MRNYLLAAAGFACSLPVSAEIVTLEFTGIVTAIHEMREGYGAAGLQVAESAAVPGTLRNGDRFHGKFSYDTATKGTPSVSHWVDYYDPASSWRPESSLVIDHSGTSIVAHGLPYLAVYDSPTEDRFDMASPNQWSPFYGTYRMSLSDYTGQAFNQNALPGDIKLSDFQYSYITMAWWDPAINMEVYVYGMPTSLSKVSPVPEPSTWALLLAGLAIAGGAGRKRILPLADRSAA